MAQRQRSHWAGLLWNLRLPGCWQQGTSSGIWFQKPLNPKGLVALLRARWDKTLPKTQGRIIRASYQCSK